MAAVLVVHTVGVFYKKGVFKKLAKFTENTCIGVSFLRIEIPTQVFYCESSEIFKNTFPLVHIRWLLLYLSERITFK